MFPVCAQNGTLKTKISPNDAAVIVDGKYLGPAGFFAVGSTYSLPAGEHEVKLTDPRYEDLTTKVNITEGKTTKLKEKMKPKELAKPPFAILRVKNKDPKAGVFINGYFYGFVDEIDNAFQGLLLPPGEYDLKVTQPGGGDDFTQKVKLEANKTTVVHSSK